MAPQKGLWDIVLVTYSGGQLNDLCLHHCSLIPSSTCTSAVWITFPNKILHANLSFRRVRPKDLGWDIWEHEPKNFETSDSS
jgi:hypothetical protein